MAPTPARIVWAEGAFSSFQQLSSRERQRLLDCIGLLESFPEMYKVVEAGRWRGLRRFFSGSHAVFYGYWPAENSVYIELIAPARRSQAE